MMRPWLAIACCFQLKDNWRLVVGAGRRVLHSASKEGRVAVDSAGRWEMERWGLCFVCKRSKVFVGREVSVAERSCSEIKHASPTNYSNNGSSA